MERSGWHWVDPRGSSHIGISVKYNCSHRPCFLVFSMVFGVYPVFLFFFLVFWHIFKLIACLLTLIWVGVLGFCFRLGVEMRELPPSKNFLTPPPSKQIYPPPLGRPPSENEAPKKIWRAIFPPIGAHTHPLAVVTSLISKIKLI